MYSDSDQPLLSKITEIVDRFREELLPDFTVAISSHAAAALSEGVLSSDFTHPFLVLQRFSPNTLADSIRKSMPNESAKLQAVEFWRRLHSICDLYHRVRRNALGCTTSETEAVRVLHGVSERLADAEIQADLAHESTLAHAS